MVTLMKKDVITSDVIRYNYSNYSGMVLNVFSITRLRALFAGYTLMKKARYGDVDGLFI